MRTLRTCEVLDTGAGPNLVYRINSPRKEVHIKTGDKPVVRDANGLDLNIVCTTNFFVRFGTYVVKIYFYLLEKLVAAYVLGGDFCDKFVN